MSLAARKMDSKRFVVTPEKIRRVLLIEDDKSLAEILKIIISDSFPQAKVDWAVNAEETFKYLNHTDSTSGNGTHPYDLVFTDIFLEGPATGFDIWRLCRQLYPDIPILVTSSLSQDELQLLLREDNEFPLYLQKPFSLDQCKEVLMRAVE